MCKTPILIIDDRGENVSILESLPDRPGLQLVHARSGHEALAKILDHEFALIVIYVRMSGIDGIDGYAVADLLRSGAGLRSIPIVLATSPQMDREHMLKGYESGAVDYLYTPFEPQILDRKIGLYIEMHRKRRQLEEKTRELDAKILELEVLHKELEEKTRKLENLSSLDCLTGLFNRRYFDDNLMKEWKQAKRDHTPLSLLIVDIDFFKEYTEYYGHLAGDDCLRKVAQGLYEALMRPTDIIARYGGEEFTALLPNTGSEGAQKIARRMMEHVAQLGVFHQGSSVAEMVTVSIGSSALFPTENREAVCLLDFADKALSEVKKSGRNGYRHIDTGCR